MLRTLAWCSQQSEARALHVAPARLPRCAPARLYQLSPQPGQSCVPLTLHGLLLGPQRGGAVVPRPRQRAAVPPGHAHLSPGAGSGVRNWSCCGSLAAARRYCRAGIPEGQALERAAKRRGCLPRAASRCDGGVRGPRCCHSPQRQAAQAGAGWGAEAAGGGAPWLPGRPPSRPPLLHAGQRRPQAGSRWALGAATGVRVRRARGGGGLQRWAHRTGCDAAAGQQRDGRCLQCAPWTPSPCRVVCEVPDGIARAPLCEDPRRILHMGERAQELSALPGTGLNTVQNSCSAHAHSRPGCLSKCSCGVAGLRTLTPRNSARQGPLPSEQEDQLVNTRASRWGAAPKTEKKRRR